MYKIHNVLSNEEREKIIKDVQPFFLNNEQMNIRYNNNRGYPGKQTDAQLHLKPEFVSVMKKILDKIKKETKLNLAIRSSWIKWSNGRKDQVNWHHHYLYKDASFAAVYYLKTLPFFSNGTLFEDGFVRAPQNSMIIFPAHILHTTPTNPFPFIDRYVMSLDLYISNSV
jgi:hypothetical protein